MFGLGLSLFQRVFKGGMSYVYDNLKLFFSFRNHQDTPITHASVGSTSFVTDDYVSIADSNDLSFGDGSTDTPLSISGWIKTDDVTNFQMINKGAYNVSAEWKLFINGSNHLKIQLFDESVASCYIGRRTGDISSIEGTWTHICATYDGGGVNSGVAIYIDGVRADTTDDAGSAASYVAMENLGVAVEIGRYTTSYTDGSIANVGIWSRALSASEIQGIMYKKYADLSTADKVSLVSFYGLDADYNDAHGSNNGTNNGSTLTATVYGGNAPSKPRILDSAPDVVDNYGTLHSGTALSFDGSNDYVEAGASNAIITGNNVTYSVWIKNTDSDQTYLFQNQKAVGSSNLGLKLNATAGEVDVLIWNGSVHATLNYDPSINDSKWHHLAFTTTASAQVLYVDGVAVATSSYTFSNSASSDLFQIGRIGSGGLIFGGSLSSVKVFNSALTLSEIQEMYLNPEQVLPTGVSSSNLKLHLPMNEGVGAYNYDGSGNQNHGTITGATWVKAETEIAQTALIRSNISSNILLQSNQFDTTWTNSNISGTSGQSGYDGNSDAWLLETSTTTGSAYQSFSETGVVVFSIYAKKGSVNGTRLRIDASTDYNGYFDLANGTVDASSSAGTAIESVGNGWYRCSVTGNVSSPVKVVIYTTNGTTAYASGTVYVQDSQMESGSVTGTYLETTTVSQPNDVFLSEGLTAGQDIQGTTLANTDENVLTLNGAEYVEVPDSDVLSFGTSDFSLEAWVKNGGSSDVETVLHSGDRYDSVGWTLYKNSSNKIEFGIDDGTTQVFTTSTTSFNDNAWHHVVLVADKSGSQYLYVDGSVEDSDSISSVGNMDTTDHGSIQIGRQWYSSQFYRYFTGKIDDVRIYSDALSSDEVTKNYNAGLSKHS